MTASVLLLGPQRFRPNLREALRSIGSEGPVAAVTAGWQEREGEVDELSAHLACEIFELRLYRRYDDVLLRDRGLASALQVRQEQLQELQQLYRLRLDHALAAARAVMSRAGEGQLLEEQRQEAIEAVRELDERHLLRVRRIHDEFEEHWRPGRRIAVARHREQIEEALGRSMALAIAGGHVAVLLNRLRLFDLAPLLAGRPVVAWSAGAMAVSEEAVLFHDSPPQGAGTPEVFDAGLGFCRGIVALPHARRRLRLDDPSRVALFSRRFSPAQCVVLEYGSRLDWDGDHWSAAPGTLRLGLEGQLLEMAAA